MYKTVFLLRHGKSDWDASYEADADRPLARRGVKAAKLMGRYLSRLGQVPDRAISSPALRAKETTKLAVKAGHWDCPIEISDTLYEASPQEVLDVIRACPDSMERLLLAGHEPTWSSVVALLTGGSAVRFPTAALARIDLPIAHWNEAQFGMGSLIWLTPPRVLSAIGWS